MREYSESAYFQEAQKACAKCLRVLPLSAFPRRAMCTSTGRRARCSECTSLDRILAKAKNKARRWLRRAVANGEVEVKPCALCDCPDVEFHHYSYLRPDSYKDGIWLCSMHHSLVHSFSSSSRSRLFGLCQMDLFRPAGKVEVTERMLQDIVDRTHPDALATQVRDFHRYFVPTLSSE